jgi:hypothetical protein
MLQLAATTVPLNQNLAAGVGIWFQVALHRCSSCPLTRNY